MENKEKKKLASLPMLGLSFHQSTQDPAPDIRYYLEDFRRWLCNISDSLFAIDRRIVVDGRVKLTMLHTVEQDHRG